MPSMTGYGSGPGGISTLSSSHIHWPEVVKLKKCPSMAKLLTKETRRPVGWLESVQLPVSSNTVLSRPTSTTSPPTPLISTQSQTRDTEFMKEIFVARKELEACLISSALLRSVITMRAFNGL